MARADLTHFLELAEAKVECDRQNAERLKTGQGKERFVYDITVQGEHKFYIVAPLAGKARAQAAMILDVQARVHERRPPAHGRSLVEQAATMSADERARLRAILDEIDNPKEEAPPVVEVVPPVPAAFEPEPEKTPPPPATPRKKK